MVERGVVAGFLAFNGRDQLRIRTGPAEVEKVITFTRAAGSAASAGNYRLCYRGYCTYVLAFNATAGAIELALEALPPFNDNDNDPITVSFGGQEAEEFPEELIYVDSLDINDGANDLFYNSALTTDFVAGFPAGNAQYTVTVSGTNVHRLESKMGELMVHTT
eukprot:TRINITY_DN6162_c0_g1_i1.p2 TRINITY_DN6162_c0_g1~~TRINITY_DN6162_c0_g1_i1.p2  ORF type:complete len:163 (+),score=44.47 TRINITY_DN6162_c0_g1_i1:709-1197(+)